jgi:hypothetical protein
MIHWMSLSGKRSYCFGCGAPPVGGAESSFWTTS